MKKIGLVSMALVLAMGILGLGPVWSDTVVAEETVTTDTVCVGIRNVSTDDPSGTLDPVWNGTEIVTSDEDVADCNSMNGDPKCLNGETQFYDSVTEDISNAYPGYAPTMTIEVANCGSVPVTVTGFAQGITGYWPLMIDFVELHYWSLEKNNGYFLEGAGEDWLYWYLIEYDGGYKLGPGEVVTLTLNLIILQENYLGEECPRGETVTLIDTFTYEANDGTTDSNVAMVTVTIPPVANNDSYSTNEDTPLTVTAPGVLGNDTDPEDNAIKVSDPGNGSVNLNGDGSFTYTPSANWNGTDSFTYKVNDGTADSNVATVTITVNPVNDAPVIQTLTTDPDELWPPNHKGVAVTINAEVNDPDGQGDIKDITYTVADEYDEFDVQKTDLGDGVIYLVAARNGRDKDGRVYTITVTVEDQAGETASCSTDVTVPHDKGKK